MEFGVWGVWRSGVSIWGSGLFGVWEFRGSNRVGLGFRSIGLRSYSSKRVPWGSLIEYRDLNDSYKNPLRVHT